MAERGGERDIRWREGVIGGALFVCLTCTYVKGRVYIEVFLK